MRNGQQFQTIARFNFGNLQSGGGGGSGGQAGGFGNHPLRPNLPDFLIPATIITYETSFEIDIRRIRPISPPPRPKFIKKLLVHTESLERKTRAFLTGSFDTSADNALRTARQKIRSLKSTILKSDDEVKHAEDTIQKAKSGQFQNIYNPYLGAPAPLYEFIEAPSEEECTDQQSQQQNISERRTSQQKDNMAEYSSSRYSSRSSRSTRNVEGNYIFFFLLHFR